MRVASAWGLALLVVLGMPRANASSDDARDWLERMSRALATLNYDGLFTHTAGRQSETMRIIHCFEDGRSLERLVSLDGSGREIVRTPEEVHFYMPDRRVVLVEPRPDAEAPLIRALPALGPGLQEVYTLEVSEGSRLLGRDVRVVDVRPRDTHRYGYRLWLDAETAMPLRSVVNDPEGRPVELIHFTRLETFEHMDLRELEPAVDATGFQWLRKGRQPEIQVAVTDWRPRKMPPGFRLVASRLQPVPGKPMPVQHLIFSDGFASVSVFIEPGPDKGPGPPESTTVGSANAFSTVVRGHVVTAVGEVPAATVRDIATSLAPASAGPEPADGDTSR